MKFHFQQVIFSTDFEGSSYTNILSVPLFQVSEAGAVFSSQNLGLSPIFI